MSVTCRGTRPKYQQLAVRNRHIAFAHARIQSTEFGRGPGGEPVIQTQAAAHYLENNAKQLVDHPNTRDRRHQEMKQQFAIPQFKSVVVELGEIRVPGTIDDVSGDPASD